MACLALAQTAEAEDGGANGLQYLDSSSALPPSQEYIVDFLSEREFSAINWYDTVYDSVSLVTVHSVNLAEAGPQLRANPDMYVVSAPAAHPNAVRRFV